jgi:hypothetical protein
MNHPDSAKRCLIVLLQRLAPDVAQKLWRVDDVRELPRDTREAICDALGHEAARRGLDANEMPNDYGRELDSLIAALGLDELA